MNNLRQFLRQWFPRVLLFTGIVLLVYLVQHFGWRELWNTATSASPGWLLVMAIVTQLSLWLRVYKWRMVLGPEGAAARLFFLAKVAGTWTPGRLGEFAPLMLGEHRNVRVAAWILTDRVMEVWMTVAFGIVGAVFIPQLRQAFGSLGTALVPVLGISYLHAIALLVALSPVVGLGMVFLYSPPKPDGHAGRLVKLVHVLHDELRLLGRKTPLLVFISAAAKALDMWAIVALFHAFGEWVGFWLAGTARLAHALVSASPVTPDTTGVPYVAAAALIHDQTGIAYATLTAAISLEILIVYSLLHLNYVAVGGLSLGKATAKE